MLSNPTHQYPVMSRGRGLMTYPDTTFLDTLRSSNPTSLNTSPPSIRSYVLSPDCTVATLTPHQWISLILTSNPFPLLLSSPVSVEPAGCVRLPHSQSPLTSMFTSSCPSLPPRDFPLTSRGLPTSLMMSPSSTP